MSKYQKTAKDKAFDEERVKLNKRIRELECQVKTKDLEIRTLKNSHEEEKRELEQLRDWNRRLLEYMDLSADELQGIICKERTEREVLATFTKIAMVLHQYGI